MPLLLVWLKLRRVTLSIASVQEPGLLPQLICHKASVQQVLSHNLELPNCMLVYLLKYLGSGEIESVPLGYTALHVSAPLDQILLLLCHKGNLLSMYLQMYALFQHLHDVSLDSWRS